MTLDTVPVEPAHLEALARTMRLADVEELARAGLAPLEALELSLARSREAWTVLFDGAVAAMYGISYPRAGEEATRVWCLTSAEVDRAPLSFWRESKAVVRRLAAKHAALCALVDSRYAAALRWTHRLGFRAQQVVDLRGSPFILVWR